MKPQTQKNIVIVGCGNLAWHLVSALTEHASFRITVCNHRPSPFLSDFAKTFPGVKTLDSLKKIADDADYYVLCVPDQHIEATAAAVRTKKPSSLLLHTSGASPVDVLGKRICGTAVMYPLQTFSKKIPVDWKSVPVFIEAGDREAEDRVRALAMLIGGSVQAAEFSERLKLHLAAVLANNFSNALFVAATQILSGSKFDLKVLMPLIRQTVEKLGHQPAVEAQTGPAKRNDSVTMKKHLRLLKSDEDLRKLYKLVSRLIQSQQKKHAKLQAKTK